MTSLEISIRAIKNFIETAKVESALYSSPRDSFKIRMELSELVLELNSKIKEQEKQLDLFNKYIWKITKPSMGKYDEIIKEIMGVENE